MIIGLTGPNAAGKGEAAEFFKSKGFTYLSLSDIIREEAKKRGMEESRENLIALGNELREKHGPEFMAAMTNKKITKDKDFIIDSIRSPAEVEELRKSFGFILIGIDAPLKLRFERAKERGRIENALTLEEFKKIEAKENTENIHAQQLHRAFEMIEVAVKNDGDLKEFHLKLNRIYEDGRGG